MLAQNNLPPQRIAFAHYFYGSTLSIFALSVLLQVFLAGEAALQAPEVWQTHVAWVHIFQWISVILPVAAYFSTRRLSFVLLNCLPLVIIGVQYSLIHIGINRGLKAFIGLHAANGALLLALLTYAGQEWRYRYGPPQRTK